MPTLGGPVAEVTVVFTPPYRTPPTSTTWFIRESLALRVSSTSCVPPRALMASRSGVGPDFWVAPVLMGRPYVSLVSTTCRSARLGLLRFSDPVPVRDQTAMRLSSGALFWKMSSGPPVISNSVPRPGSREVEGCREPQNGRFVSPVGTVPTLRCTRPTLVVLVSRLDRPRAKIWPPLKKKLGLSWNSLTLMNTPSLLAPSSGWSGRHGQPVWAGVPFMPSSLVSRENRFQFPVGSLVWLTAMRTWVRLKGAAPLKLPGASTSRTVWMKRLPIGSK